RADVLTPSERAIDMIVRLRPDRGRDAEEKRRRQRVALHETLLRTVDHDRWTSQSHRGHFNSGTITFLPSKSPVNRKDPSSHCTHGPGRDRPCRSRSSRSSAYSKRSVIGPRARGARKTVVRALTRPRANSSSLAYTQTSSPPCRPVASVT